MKPLCPRFALVVRLALVASAGLLAAPIARALPDLVVTEVDASALAVDCVDGAVSGVLTVTVKNIGDASPAVATKALAFVDADHGLTFQPPPDVSLGEVAIPILGPTEEIEVDIPLAGELSFVGAPITVMADSRSVLAEKREDNNLRSTLNAVEAGVADFELSDVKYVLESTHDIMMTPIVAQLTDDNGDGQVNGGDILDLVYVKYATDHDQWGGGYLCIARAADGEDETCLTSIGSILPSGVTPAVGDIDGDTVPEIVAPDSDLTHLWCFQASSTSPRLSVKWTSSSHAIAGRSDIGSLPVIANLDGRDQTEIIVGSSVYSATGAFIARGGASPLNGFEGKLLTDGTIPTLSAVADLDLDGVPELIAGACAYHLRNGVLSIIWKRSDVGEGWVSIGNLDDDPEGEVVITQYGKIRVLDADGSDCETWNPSGAHGWITLPVASGSAATVADFDGDGAAEIAVQSYNNVTAYESDGTPMWSAYPLQDSSGFAPPAAFDFDLDGAAEIIARGEEKLLILDGATGTLQDELVLSSGTGLETVSIADVDMDGHAELLVGCSYTPYVSGYSGTFGIACLRNDAWPSARSLWNQHAYSVSNIREDGSIPRKIVNRWKQEPPGDWRRQVSPGGVTPADLTASRITSSTGNPCEDEGTTVTVRIGNAGGAAANNVSVALYAGEPPAELLAPPVIIAFLAGGVRCV